MFLCAGFPSTCSSLLSSQAGHPPKHPSAGQTSPQCQQALLRPLGPGMRPWGAAVPWEQVMGSRRATLRCLNPRQSVLRPRPSTQIPSAPPRPQSPPLGLQTQDSLSQPPPRPLWTLMLRKRRPARRQCGQKVISN